MAVLAQRRSFLHSATRELGQHGTVRGGGWGSGLAALGSHGSHHVERLLTWSAAPVKWRYLHPWIGAAAA